MAHDLEISNVKEHVVYVKKYFRNHHLALAKYRNVGLKRSAEDLFARLEPITDALDSIQQQRSSIADAVAAWKLLESKFLPIIHERALKHKFQTRYDQAITLPHILAYLLHPQYQGSSLSSQERDKALEYANLKTHTLCQL